LSDSSNNQIELIGAKLNAPPFGATLDGIAGSPGATPVKVHVDAFGLAVPNASVRLLNANDPATGATAMCATGAGADPGSILTDANGDGICTPVFGSISGAGNLTVLIGGVDPAAVDPNAQGYVGRTTPIGYKELGGLT